MEKNKWSKQSLLRNNIQTKPDLAYLSVDIRNKLINIRNLTDSTYVLRFERKNIQFVAGQHITLGLPGDPKVREYSIYSPVNQPYIEVLIKEVEDGLVSKKLHKLKSGDILNVGGPFGFFTLDMEKHKNANYLFVATGTGIAPFHSIAGSYADLSYTIIHGVRFSDEGYEKSFYPTDRYVQCTSSGQGDFGGRVTDYIKKYEVDKNTLVYLCGNCDMIYEVYDLLTSRGLPSEQIKTEVYF